MALDWDQVEKTQGDPAEEFESMRERRVTLLLAYGVSERIGFFARVPYSERALTESEEEESERTRVRGLANPRSMGRCDCGRPDSTAKSARARRCSPWPA